MASVRARPVDRPRSAATSAARRQARTGTSAPTRIDETCAAANVAPGHGHRDRGEERRQWQPDLEGRSREGQRRRLEAPDRVGDEAASVDQVACHVHVVGRVLGLREHDPGARTRRASRARPRTRPRRTGRPRAASRGRPASVVAGCRADRVDREVADPRSWASSPPPGAASYWTMGGPTQAGRSPAGSARRPDSIRPWSRTSQRMS